MAIYFFSKYLYLYYYTRLKSKYLSIMDAKIIVNFLTGNIRDRLQGGDLSLERRKRKPTKVLVKDMFVKGAATKKNKISKSSIKKLTQLIENSNLNAILRDESKRTNRRALEVLYDIIHKPSENLNIVDILGPGITEFYTPASLNQLRGFEVLQPVDQPPVEEFVAPEVKQREEKIPEPQFPEVDPLLGVRADVIPDEPAAKPEGKTEVAMHAKPIGTKRARTRYTDEKGRPIITNKMKQQMINAATNLGLKGMPVKVPGLGEVILPFDSISKFGLVEILGTVSGLNQNQVIKQTTRAIDSFLGAALQTAQDRQLQRRIRWHIDNARRAQFENMVKVKPKLLMQYSDPAVISLADRKLIEAGQALPESSFKRIEDAVLSGNEQAYDDMVGAFLMDEELQARPALEYKHTARKPSGKPSGKPAGLDMPGDPERKSPSASTSGLDFVGFGNDDFGFDDEFDESAFAGIIDEQSKQTEFKTGKRGEPLTRQIIDQARTDLGSSNTSLIASDAISSIVTGIGTFLLTGNPVQALGAAATSAVTSLVGHAVGVGSPDDGVLTQVARRLAPPLAGVAAAALVSKAPSFTEKVEETVTGVKREKAALPTQIVKQQQGSKNQQWKPKQIAPTTEILEPTPIEAVQDELLFTAFDYVEEGDTGNGGANRNVLVAEQEIESELRYLGWRQQILRRELEYRRQLGKKMRPPPLMQFENMNPSQFETQSYNPEQPLGYNSPYRMFTDVDGLNIQIKKSELYGRVE